MQPAASTCWLGPARRRSRSSRRSGVKRISVGGAFAFAALGALVEAATELRDQGTYGYRDRMVEGIRAARSAFNS